MTDPGPIGAAETQVHLQGVETTKIQAAETWGVDAAVGLPSALEEPPQAKRVPQTTQGRLALGEAPRLQRGRDPWSPGTTVLRGCTWQALQRPQKVRTGHASRPADAEAGSETDMPLANQLMHTRFVAGH